MPRIVERFNTAISGLEKLAKPPGKTRCEESFPRFLGVIPPYHSILQGVEFVIPASALSDHVIATAQTPKV